MFSDATDNETLKLGSSASLSHFLGQSHETVEVIEYNTTENMISMVLYSLSASYEFA